jgi:hypothetical protein
MGGFVSTARNESAKGLLIFLLTPGDICPDEPSSASVLPVTLD